MTTRTPLSRERVLDAAVALADAGGVASLTMRRLGQALGVEAMSLYKHVANKDAILGGIVDLVVSEIEVPDTGTDWRAGMRQRAFSARAVFARHPWALGVIESRPDPGPATLRYHEAVIGCLRRGGFSIEMALHAGAVLDSFVYGFAVQEMTLPFSGADELTDVTRDVLEQLPADEFPYMAEMAGHVMRSGYDFSDEFTYGLDLLLDALERAKG